MTFKGIWEGVISLKDVRNIPLFVFFTLGIWVVFPALLPHLLLFRFHRRPGTGLCAGDLYRRFHRRHRTHSQWRRSLAFRRQDDADTLWYRR